MIVQGEPIGGFFAAWFEKEHRCTPAELRLVDGISRQAGIALANARLVEELKARQSRLEALLRVSHELARIQPVESLLGGIAKTSGQLFGANAVTFHLVEGEELVLRGNWNEAEDFMASPRLRIGQSLTGSVVTSGELLVVQDPADDARMAPAHRENYRRQGVRAFLAAPVKIDDKVIGVLGIRTCQVEGFSKADVEMARALASQAAIALENSRLYQEVQRAFDELSPTKDQLVQAQKMDAIGQLAGGIAHDFNNILTVIGGRSQLLLARVAADDRARPDIQLIAHASERATALTRQLLAFSRKQVLEPRALDLNVLAGGLAPMLSRLIGAHIGGHAIVLTYSRPAAVFPVARAVWRADGLRAALQSLRWLLPTAAFELARGGARRYLAPGELAALLLEHGLVPIGSCPAFLGGISQLTWSRRTAEAPASAAGASSAIRPAQAHRHPN